MPYIIFSDNIRGPINSVSSVDSYLNNTSEFTVTPEQIIALNQDNAGNVPVKLQMEIRLSETLKSFPNSFALFFYNNIDPEPDNSIISYKGDLVKYIVLPEKSRHYVELYFENKPSRSDIIPGTDIITPDEFKKTSFPMLLSVLPVMKGIPDKLLDEKIRIKITAFYPDKGELFLNIFEKQNNSAESNSTPVSDYTLFIDNRLFSGLTFPLTMNAGVKKIRIEKEGFLTYEQSVTINKNEKNTLNIYLIKKAPHVVIHAPSEAEVFIDGNLYKQKEIANLAEGEHTIIFKLGEYSLSRKFTAENGKKYVINLFLDIDITEN